MPYYTENGEKAVELEKRPVCLLPRLHKCFDKVRYERNVKNVAEPRYRWEGVPINPELILGTNCYKENKHRS